MRRGVSEIGRKWNISRRLAVWFWGVLALLLSADFYGNLYAYRTGRPAGAEEWAHSGIPRTYEAAEADWTAGSAGTVALTFDDGPHEICTPRLLDGLKERGVKASFFLIGQNIDGKEEIVLRMQREGHLIGNHSQSHMQLTAESIREASGQIGATNRKIQKITGVMPEYLRPPYGSWSEKLESAVPMTVALWNLDPLDWKLQDKDAVVRYVVEHVENGSIILLHDVYETSVEAALEIVDTLSRKGYEFVTIDELLIE